MLLSNHHSIDINSVLEPSFSFIQHNLVATHLSLPHPTLFIEGPMLNPVASFPYCSPLLRLFSISELIPELDSNLVVLPRKQLFPQPIIKFMLPFLF